MKAEQSGHPESSQGPSDFCTVYSQMLYQLSYSRNGLCPQATSRLFAIVCCTGENGGRDDLERFFEQEQFSKTGVEKPPKSSRPRIFQSTALPSPLQTAVWTGKILRLTNSTAETLPVEVPGG